MRKNWYYACLVGLMLYASHEMIAQYQFPSPKFVPPDLEQFGELEHYKDLAIIETSCSSPDDVNMLVSEIIERGALVSVVTPSHRMLAWVPRDANDAVASARVQTARGEVAVLSISYDAASFRARNRNSIQGTTEDAEADETILNYLEEIKRPKSPLELQKIEDRQLELAYLQSVMPAQDCFKYGHVEGTPPQKYPGQSLQGGPGDQILRATKLMGRIEFTSFYLESQTGTGSWNWDPTVYDRYKNFLLASFNYWTGFASRYGSSCWFDWRLYGRTSSVTQISGEPVTVGEDSFIPTCIRRVSSGTPPSWSWAGPGLEYCWMYNNQIRAAISGASEAICGFIAYKPSGDEGIWPHANGVCWSGCSNEIEGVYWALDTRYWQAGLNPFAAPDRNVMAHETGHLFGCPDEYASHAGCYNDMYRSLGNINCQRDRSAPGRPGFTLTGYDGMMGWNYLRGASTAQSVHVGIRTAANVGPIRCISTQPANIPITIFTSDQTRFDGRTYNSSYCFPLEYNFSFKVWVPLTRTISGTTWYFNFWRVKQRSGTTLDIDWYDNELTSWAFNSTLANPNVDVIAMYTSTPPDFNTVNTSVSAWLGTHGMSAVPTIRAVALKWKNKYDMSRVETRIEYERSPGSWVELTGSNMTMGPFAVPIGKWTGVNIVSVPGAGAPTPIAANTTYKFRIRGYFNTIAGAASNPASITTRPASPADTAFMYDAATEPNSSGSPKVLTSSGPGMDPYTVKAACPVGGVTGEFSWFPIKSDFYRITVIGLAGSAFSFGERLQFSVHVRPGSYFTPKIYSQRVGTTTWTSGGFSSSDSTWNINLYSDGEYIIKIEPEMTTYISNDFVNRNKGCFGFGEYEMTVSRTSNTPIVVALCPSCIKLQVHPPFPGHFVMSPKFDIFGPGVPNTMDSFFDVFFELDPGFDFDGFDSDFGGDPPNPFQVQINRNTKPGIYSINPRTRRKPVGETELVIINPDGPGTPTKHLVGAVGRTETATATTPTPPPDYVFVGWGYDTSAVTNPLPVVMWKSKKIIAYWRQKPCQPEPMTEWLHRANFVNSRQGSVLLEYGMQPGAGDGLEPGQVDLPPIPPPGTFDIRWINIVGSQGSTTDHRAIQPSFTFVARVQTGTGTIPVRMSWGAPPVSPNATYTMKVAGDPIPIDMRTVFSYDFTAEGTYQVTIEVKAKICPPPTNPPEVTVTPVHVDRSNFPCIIVDLLIRARQDGNILPFYDPHKLKFFEKNKQGEDVPALYQLLAQTDSFAKFRICSTRDDNDPNRDIRVVNDNDDPDTQKDTTNVRIQTPDPNGEGKIARFVKQNSGDWEMISLPLLVETALPSILYPDPMTKLFRFNTTTGVYENVPLMEFGVGYWLKTDVPSTTFIGNEKLTHTYTGLSGVGEPYGYGWNMIGPPSKSLAVAAIVATPTGGLRAIFGFNPSTGYTVPTTLMPGLGYWVRLNPSTTLQMTGTGFTGSGLVTAYQRIAQGLNIAGQIDVTTGANQAQSLMITSNPLHEQELDALQLPILPPDGLFDVRTKEGTRYLHAGDNVVHLQAPGSITLELKPMDESLVSCHLYTEKGELLHVFDVRTGGTFSIRSDGAISLLLKIETKEPVIRDLALEQSYPNPSALNTSTVIPYRIATGAHAELSVFDMLGRRIRTLVSSEMQPGTKTAVWDLRDDSGTPVTPGMYVYRLESGDRIVSRTLTVVR